MDNWFNQVRKNTDYIIQAIKVHPFITELLDGSLSKETFQFYINQDTLYLGAYKKVLASIGLKCTEPNDMQFFLNSATGIIEVETALHQLFLTNGVITNEPSPSCEFYVSYLEKITSNNFTIEEGLAAVLPCFTIYKEIGDYILEHQKNKQSNPFQNWIDTYGGEDFASSVLQAVEIVNRYASEASIKTIQKMNTTFEKASKLEWMFWDSAYKKEQWAI